MIRPLTATYRLQMRGGMDFAKAGTVLPYLADLGVSHVYLSPIFTADDGSTHGYDVVDPTEIEPGLGGVDGFRRLADQAHGMGLGVILDCVPNHTAFSLSNPWLWDVLKWGAVSRYAMHFDIDWALGRVKLPWLEAPFETMLADGAFRVVDDAEGGLLFDTGGMQIPMQPRTEIPEDRRDDPEALRKAHDAQHWQLVHWEMERDSVSHRRFFNITGLIGMRVEDPQVFEDTHALLFDLVDSGHVDGVRLDHIDGLADPTGYLDRLAQRLPQTPVWVEKILVGDEPLPDWPVSGTTGYEAGRALARVLTQPEGLAELDRLWRKATGYEGDFHAALDEAKGEVLRRDLGAELQALLARVETLAEADPTVEFGAETLREALIALIIAFPRYRSYITEDEVPPGDAALWTEVADTAAAQLRIDTALRWLAGKIIAPEGDEAAAFVKRLQQTTGALLAKAHEDTAAFRYNRYLAANEVGAEPDAPCLDAAGFDAHLAHRQKTQPLGLTLTSSHDTKRSEDARMRLVAISHAPEAFWELWESGAAIDGASDVDANLRWFGVQAALAIWDGNDPAIPDRLREHLTKAMREAKEITNWVRPDEAAEARALDWIAALAGRWAQTPPDGLLRLAAIGEGLSLRQVALKLTMPGVPDIYQGAEGPLFQLTDPDNRAEVDFDAMAALPAEPGFAGDKARLTRALLALRRDHPDLFRDGAASWSDGTLYRADGGTRLSVATAQTDPVPGGRRIWPDTMAEGADGAPRLTITVNAD
ncbi:malto-oligosyltrehalose synthase [Mesobaculum littorinae]|uniref:Malto-oligosyltrehalose synthase n=1 Tax=Mesobaculum littorinae TaxID=2486419 RepID=A0A438AIC5_9RHOB|nr:malto-oligosyltrehalose synthase [Mesobaculum littorinae]RVV98459.1 malto-oligosyltrehalose synthase [Mesobaculum littorinae]